MEHLHPFTLKWVLSDGGVTFFAAKTVSTIPHVMPNGCEVRIGIPKRIEFDKADGSDIRGVIDRGLVYVMNSQGKTIDRFDLDQTPPNNVLPVADPHGAHSGETENPAA